jgi:DNA-binding response OmpR family regulator
MNVDDTALKTVVSRLRRKLEAEGFRIASSRGEGYRFE